MFGLGVTLYLFFAGAGAGLFLVSYLSEHFVLGRGRRPRDLNLLYQKIPVVVIILMSAAGLFLLSDIKRPELFLLAFANAGTSLLSTGATLVLVFTALVVARIALRWSISHPSAFVSDALGILGALAAAGVIAYTGIFLMTLQGVPFWSTPLIPALFVVSSISSGLSVFCLLATMSLRRNRLPEVALRALRVDHAMLAVEAVLLVALLVDSHCAGGAAAESVERLLGGELTWAFCILCLVGLAFPFAVGFVEGPKMSLLQLCRMLSVLLGCLALRYCVIEAAVRAFVS